MSQASYKNMPQSTTPEELRPHQPFSASTGGEPALSEPAGSTVPPLFGSNEFYTDVQHPHMTDPLELETRVVTTPRAKYPSWSEIEASPEFQAIPDTHEGRLEKRELAGRYFAYQVAILPQEAKNDHEQLAEVERAGRDFQAQVVSKYHRSMTPGSIWDTVVNDAQQLGANFTLEQARNWRGQIETDQKELAEIQELPDDAKVREGYGVARRLIDQLRTELEKQGGSGGPGVTVIEQIETEISGPIEPGQGGSGGPVEIAPQGFYGSGTERAVTSTLSFG